MATTYTLISSVTVGSGGAANIEFTSIPATYTDLLIKFNVRSSRAANQDDCRLAINGSSSSFTYRQLYGGASSGSPVAGSSSGSAGFIGIIPAVNNTASTFSSQEIYILNYAGSNNKSISIDSAAENNAATYWQLDLIALLWSNSNAINSLSFTSNNAANFAQYSTAYLYGISNA
jgi:hypothetical protein